MFDIKKYDAKVEVACVRKHHTWAAKIETKTTPSVRSAANPLSIVPATVSHHPA
jgi:hypothetical protein